VDSVFGLVSIFLVVANIFRSSVRRLMGCDLSLAWIPCIVHAVIGAFSLYVKHKLGSSMQSWTQAGAENFSANWWLLPRSVAFISCS